MKGSSLLGLIIGLMIISAGLGWIIGQTLKHIYDRVTGRSRRSVTILTACDLVTIAEIFTREDRHERNTARDDEDEELSRETQPIPIVSRLSPDEASRLQEIAERCDAGEFSEWPDDESKRSRPSQAWRLSEALQAANFLVGTDDQTYADYRQLYWDV
jgi:hypothetical protein